MKPLYSVCMCNYNMAKTISRAVDSIASQLDERFEIVLVDDGSTDDSVSVIHELVAQHPSLRVVTLTRDRRRKLGETRNLSVREARGDYCLLHLDCDDVWEPHIVAWVEVFHQIESAIGSNILLAGQQLHMARRDLLLRHGPYPNIFRGEDRAMYARFGSLGILWFLEHQVFRTRSPLTRGRTWRRFVAYTFDHLLNDFRRGERLGNYILSEIKEVRTKSTAYAVYRMGILPLTWVLAKLKRPVLSDVPIRTYKAIFDYRNAHTGSFSGLMLRHGAVPDWPRISQPSRKIFDQ